MGTTKTLRQLAAAATALFQLQFQFHFHYALALPQAGTTVPAAAVPWVTVDPSGGASTVTPVVFTTEGQRTTVQEAPASLLSTATYTLSPPGRPASTYTGLAPVASATGSAADGVFLACGNANNVGPDEPFCLPKSGSVLYPGRTYYITWSPSYFSPASTPLALQATFPPSSVGLTIAGPFPASQGFYAWSIPSDFLSSRTAEQLNLTFTLVQNDTSTPEGNDIRTYGGPTVYLTPSSSPTGMGPSGSGGTPTNTIVAIAVPVVVITILLLFSGLCFLSYRRHGTIPLLSTLRKRRPTVGGGIGGGGGAGYGVRQSRAERMGTGAALPGDNKSETDVGGVELTDRDSWSPTYTARSAAGGEGRGRNVFREELARQESLRQGRMG
ncbi:hypothetical protein N656DRAFT_783829 [Canariomyces notabilis]|uniref:Uncharacterized protein n=1 Tax=Canariomyces notabilis TaxID=2074819 RepID=A0AAN6QER1_9PEZI|nr:hypothetical protein N656DRAFT_783829 [Canariomyces arenarius]